MCTIMIAALINMLLLICIYTNTQATRKRKKARARKSLDNHGNDHAALRGGSQGPGKGNAGRSGRVFMSHTISSGGDRLDAHKRIFDEPDGTRVLTVLDWNM